MTWRDSFLRRFAEAACDSRSIYYLQGRGGYAAQEGDLSGFEAFLPLWTSESTALASRTGDWEDFMVCTLPLENLPYFKDDFITNRWAAACYVQGDERPVETSFISLVAAIARERGRRGFLAPTLELLARARRRSSALETAYPKGLKPAYLRKALERFITRVHAMGLAGRLSSPRHLDDFDTRFPGVMPRWYREVLARAAIGDITFDAGTDFGRGWAAWGHFRDAETLLVEIDSVFPDEKLTKNGYLPIGAAGDGDCWVIRSASTPDDPVFLCEMSSYGTPDPADSKNCLLKHSESFAAFLDEINPSPNAF